MSTNSTNSLIERLFKAGAHFGFRKSRRHPTVTPYLYTLKDGNDIFNLEKTSVLLTEAAAVLKEAGSNGKVVVLVGTKDEVSRLVRQEAEKHDLPFVSNRWIGGMMTNFSEIRKRINRLESLVSEKESGEMERKYTKKERVLLNRETDKLQFNFGGIKSLTKTPDMLVVVDPRHDTIAVTEAREIGIPVVAIMSSDCDAKTVTHPVFVNDTLQSSVSLALSELMSAYKEGAATYVPKPVTNTRSGDRRPMRRGPRRTA